MDPHSDYLSVSDEKMLSNQITNKFGGIGVQLNADNDGAKITVLDPGGPCMKSGEVQVGDVIMKMAEDNSTDFRELAGLTVAEIVVLIRGEVGTTLKIVIKKPDGLIKTVLITREEVAQANGFVKAGVMEKGNKKIGFISFPQFYSSPDPMSDVSCSRDVENALLELKSNQVDGIVFDLRRNGGGSLHEAVKMVSLLIKDGPVVQVKDNMGNVIARTARDIDMMRKMGGKAFVEQVYNGPVAVMVDEFSASASEIFAAAIQDYHRGVIIGSTTSYGKGTVQKVVPLDVHNGGSLKLTFNQFYRVNGSSTQLNGIVPDIILPDINEHLKVRERDMILPLPWDMIAPAKYELWEGKMNLRQLAGLASERIKQDTSFRVLEKNSKWIGLQKEQKVSLNIEAYKDAATKLKEIIAQNEQATKLPPDKWLKVLPVMGSANPSLNHWIDTIKKDIYIDQAVDVIINMADDRSQ
jgi:carboxyl-terminal processing protease